MSSTQGRAVRVSCYIRALALLKTVEATVRSFAKTSNTALQDRLRPLVEQSGLDLGRLEAHMVRDLTSSRPSDQGEEDFQDLESLAKRKLRLLDELEVSESGTKLVSMPVFENKWFGFLLQL